MKTKKENNSKKVKKATKRHRMCQLRVLQTQIFVFTENRTRN